MTIYVISITQSPKLYGRKFNNWASVTDFMREMSDGCEISFAVLDDLSTFQNSDYDGLADVEIEIVEAD